MLMVKPMRRLQTKIWSPFGGLRVCNLAIANIDQAKKQAKGMSLELLKE